jgi:predicted ATPase/class 3 adenylate cyclase
MKTFQKITAKTNPDPGEISRLKNEYFITRHLEIKGIVKATGLTQTDQHLILDLEEFDGISLQDLLSTKRLELLESLKIAVKSAKILNDIHQADIIHQNISPKNILINQERDEIRLAGFGLAFKGKSNRLNIHDLILPDGGWLYISPEQTGRMSRRTDQRSDLYSLGIVLYSMLSDRPPFPETEALKLIHAHLARKPVPLSRLEGNNGPAIPEMVSRIVARLMEKNAEDRYQSAFGLLKDLERCVAQLEANGHIEEFEMGSFDHTGRLQISQKIYGRERETSILHEAYEESIAGRSKAVLIAGKSGVGKTTLVRELQQSVNLSHGVFIESKFQDFTLNIPYYGILDAVGKFVDLILAEKEEDLAAWKSDIKEAVGSYGKLLFDRIPKLQLIIDDRPAPDIDIRDIQNLFNSIILRLLHTITRRIRPLVLYLDDLHWADSASLKLIHDIITRFHNNYLFFIGSFRSDELRSDHPFLIRLGELRQSGIEIERIDLLTLSEADVFNFIRDSFQQEGNQPLEQLASLFYEKTGGNAFYLNQFLQSLYQKNLFTFDRKKKVWKWDLQEIHHAPATDNVVELVKGKLSTLPEEILDLLCLAACLGNTFNNKALAEISAQPDTVTTRRLLKAVEENIITPVDHPGWQSLLWDKVNRVPDIHFRFLHDEVYHAAYQLLDEQEKMNIHRRIGAYMAKQLTQEEQEEKIFEICNHFNHAIPIIDDPKARISLSWRNLLACKRAKQASAFETSRRYIDIARRLQKENESEGWYELRWNIYKESTELAYFTLDEKALERFSSAAIKLAHTPVMQAGIYEIRIINHIQNSRLSQALAECFQILDKLGVHIASNPKKYHIVRDLVLTQLTLRGRTPEDLESLPPLAGKEKVKVIQALRIMKQLGHAAFFTSPNILAVTVLKMIRFTLTHGKSELAAVGYLGYAIILCGTLNNQKLGVRFGRLALTLIQGAPEGHHYNFIKYIYYGFIHYWRAPLSTCFPPLREALEDMHEKGDWENTSFAALIYLSHKFHAGEPIPKILELGKKMEGYISPIIKADSLYRIELQALHNFSRREKDPVRFAGPYFFEETDYPDLEKRKDGNALGFFALYKSLAYILFGKFSRVFSDPRVGPERMEFRKSSLHYPLYLFIRSFARCRLVRENKSRRAKYLRMGRKNLQRLRKYSLQAPENFEDMYLIIKGDYESIRGEWSEALRWYQEAAIAARKYEHPLFEGLAWEASADLFMMRENSYLAALSHREAMFAFQQWGADTKVDLVEHAFQKERAAQYIGGIEHFGQKRQDLSSVSGKELDESTVWQAMRAITKEVQLNSLIRTILTLAMENAGADIGMFFMKEEEEWRIKASLNSTKGQFAYDCGPLSAGTGDLPESVVNYVIRTKETVILNDPAGSKLFSSDPYIQSRQPQSILCTPVDYKDQDQSILYLVNTVTKGAFTSRRVELLNLLLLQTAISIENAKLYQNLDEAYQKQVNLTNAYHKFVPHKFLESLGRDSILEVRLGDQIKKAITIFFSDIRSYTNISETMSPIQNFNFINEYLHHIVPLIRDNDGFVNQYLGDGIMALFMNKPEDAIDAAIRIQQKLQKIQWNTDLNISKKIVTGIGIHFGPLMLGIIGTENRLDAAVVADAVNTASRMEGLTKQFGVSVLVSQQAFEHIREPQRYNYRFLGEVMVKGKRDPIGIYDFFDGDPPDVIAKKKATNLDFQAGLSHFLVKDYAKSAQYFHKVLEIFPDDQSAEFYLESCSDNLLNRPNSILQ